MSLNLLSQQNFNILSLLEWDVIISSISSLTHFEISKEKFWRNLSPKSHSKIDYEYNSLQYYLTKLVHNTAIESALSEIPSEERYFNLIFQLSKDKIATIEELNFLCLLLENFQQINVVYSMRNFGGFLEGAGHFLYKS